MKWWDELYIAGESFNVNAVVVHSLASCLELCYWLLLSRNGLSENNIKSLGMLIDNTRFHMWKLKEMCANLLSIPRGRQGQAKIAAAKESRTKIPRVRLHKLIGGTKEHIAGKYPFYYKWIGVDRIYTDVEIDELAHKVYGKEAFEHSNKQYEGDTMQMLAYVMRKDGLSRLNDAIPSISSKAWQES